MTNFCSYFRCRFYYITQFLNRKLPFSMNKSSLKMQSKAASAAFLLMTTACNVIGEQKPFEISSEEDNFVEYNLGDNIDITTSTLDLGDGRTKEASLEGDLYYPYQGEYTVSLKNNKGEVIDSQKVVIKQDDADYIKDMELVWADDFNGTSVNLDSWTFETGSHGWGNNELQNYTNGDNAKVENGNLTIIASKHGDEATQNVGQYTSTRMITKDKREFLYGRIEASLKMPGGKGGWAAFWTLGTDIAEVGWPACGEIDIMEYVGHEFDKHHVALHTPSSHGATINTHGVHIDDMETEFHVYGCIWDSKSIQFYVDDVDNVVYTYKPEEYNDQTWPYNKPHFILLNLAIGGTLGGQQGVDDKYFPKDYVVDYVRVYQNKNY